MSSTRYPRAGRRERRRRCKACDNDASAVRYRRTRDGDPAAYRRLWGHEAHVRRRYGLTPAELDALVLESEGRCGICGRATPDLLVDHCHSTGRVRGLLCQLCNSGLGCFEDATERLLRAADYLRAR